MTAKSLTFFRTSLHKCSYLDNEDSRTVFLDPLVQIKHQLHGKLSRNGFRRSGDYIYKPDCVNCNQCISVRIPVDEFYTNRQQRRAIKQNSDLLVSRKGARINAELFKLYNNYISARHSHGDMYPASEEQYQSFFLSSWANTFFYEFRIPDGTLVMVSVVDELDDGLSAVYTFFDPSEDKRSLGRYAILWQIEELKRLKLNFLYLGYWVQDAMSMNYKTEYKPQQHYIDNQWKYYPEDTNAAID